jgi:hypothetical protein
VVFELQTCSGTGNRHRPNGRQLPGAGDEIGMNVGLDPELCARPSSKKRWNMQ